MEKINVALYGGKSIFGGRETRLEADEIFCDRAEQCTYYQSGKCLRCRSFLSPICKFGRNNVISGYTSRAKRYYEFKRKYENDEVYSKLKYPEELVAVMGDTLYMNLKYVSVRERTEKDEKWEKDIEGYMIRNGSMGCRGIFIPLQNVSTTLLYSIFSYTPHAIMGGIITDYEDKVVPDIIQTLKKVAPNIHKDFIKKYSQYDKEPNYIGKKVFVNSLKPNTKFTFKNKEWTFDGAYVVANNFDIGLGSPWWLQDGQRADVKIKVTDKMTIEINDNSIVDENTKFV